MYTNKFPLNAVKAWINNYNPLFHEGTITYSWYFLGVELANLCQ